jgi:2-haloacid dehalogenase
VVPQVPDLTAGTERPALEVDALLFDVFGTLVDWRTSLIEDLTGFGDERGLSAVDWAALVDAWRAAYVPALDRVRRGEVPWTPLDALHRQSFDALAARFGIAVELDEEARRWCVDRWHRLRPWPDTVAGLARLRARYVLGTLSNGNLRLLVDLCKSAPLPVDAVFSAELFRHYKPDPEVYRGAVDLLATTPERVMLVAAHPSDLRAAAEQGLRTAFVARPTEYGPQPPTAERPDPAGFDLAVYDLGELADRLGA